MRWFVLMVVAVSAMASDIIDTPEGLFSGRWVEVAATAYTPTNAIDSEYHASKGTRWRWILADGKTHAKRTPYGIAVKLFEGKDGKWRPALPFGTRVYIPTGYGYLDRARKDERIFTVDDGSASTLYQTKIEGRMHVDLRWIDTGDAIRWSGATGHQNMRVFVIEQEVVREPARTWPAVIAELDLPEIPRASANARAPEPRHVGGWVMLLLLPLMLARLLSSTVVR